MPENKKLFLLDAMALIYRAFYALNKNPRINSKGLNTSAIVESIKKQKTFCFDTETTGLNTNESELVGMSFALKPGDIKNVI
jgi:5'-3' exonuclease